MLIELRAATFDPWQELQSYESRNNSVGANVVFVGRMRDFNLGTRVSAMNIEHYPEMTEQQLQKITRIAISKYELVDAMVLHRVGEIAVSEAIVLVAVWSAQRAAGFAACREIMEALKTRATFWKQEITGDGRRWVSENTQS